MHLATDVEMNIHVIGIPATEVSDSKGAKTVLPADVRTDRVLTNGACNCIERTEALSRAGATPAFHRRPTPSCKATTRLAGMTRSSDTFRTKAYAFRKTCDYGSRSLVEAQFSRNKRSIGTTLLTQISASQQREGAIIAKLVNLWNAFGRPVCITNTQLRTQKAIRTLPNKAVSMLAVDTESLTFFGQV
ncbi:hypothetical protein R75465_08025 [Paraburkholderia aspalathi]|uniref:hypothetical protein n=1 Tax=Paraburkholderia aspalathi TaxID=1324617 RepID=UPI001B234EA2|nr:hypothetical protein [Paraburkholderia aspalathi]CAE6866976.1 hypothetical protein R75465_08025 [Paraburkholderia aspalathi]